MDFLIKNTVCYNRKYENRKKYFLSIQITKEKEKSKNIFRNRISDQVYYSIIDEIEKLLQDHNQVLIIIKKIFINSCYFKKTLINTLIIPFKLRLNMNEFNEKEFLNLSYKKLISRNKKSLIISFLNILFNPNKFVVLSELIYDKVEEYQNFINKVYSIISNGDIIVDELKSWDIKKARNKNLYTSKFCVFVNKFYYLKLKNIYSVEKEYENEFY